MEEYYIIYNGQQVGPMTREQLLAYGLNPNSQVWRKGTADWAPAYTIPELMEVISKNANAAQPPQTPYSQADGSYGEAPKEKIVAGLLAIFLGGLGIHYFYLNKVTAGVVSIVLSLVSCGIWSLVMFIQGIVMLCMTDQEFQRKYVNSASSFPVF